MALKVTSIVVISSLFYALHLSSLYISVAKMKSALSIAALASGAAASLMPAQVVQRGYEWVIKPKVMIVSML